MKKYFYSVITPLVCAMMLFTVMFEPRIGDGSRYFLYVMFTFLAFLGTGIGFLMGNAEDEIERFDREVDAFIEKHDREEKTKELSN